LARYLPDGNLEFLGRVDFQVKLRGHRIELGEVECVLEECAGVQQAVVVLREDREGDQRLVAYLVGDPQTASAASLKGQLAAKLPETMSPSAFIFLPALPLTANGKVDRKALLASPSPMTTKPAGAAQIQRHPENDIVRFVSEVWRDALGVEEVGLNENFYDMGAHSLTVAEVHAKLQNGLGYEISIVDLFQFPTISSLCRHLMGAGSRDVAHRASERAQRRRLARQG
jgi:acyl carrier protein